MQRYITEVIHEETVILAEEELNWLIDYKRKPPHGHGIWGTWYMIKMAHTEKCNWPWTIGYPGDGRYSTIRSLPHIIPKASILGGLKT